ncbi:MAG: MFS transporter [Akkermansiaceae bacterium]
MSSEIIDGNPPKRNWVSFWSLLVLQGQNAFNDKAAQFLLIPMGVWLFKEQVDIPMLGAMKYIEYILAAVIVLPFILFSPIAGWFSDRFSKTYVVRGSAVLQLIVLLWIAAAIHYQQVWFAVAGFFMLSVQSVMLSPAKRGLVKELVGHEKLGFASGMLEITVVLTICGGQIVTGFWYTGRLESGLDGWESAMLPLQVITIASIVALIISMVIQTVPSQGKRPFQARIIFEHFSQVGELWKERALKLSAVGAAFFWGYAGFLNLAAINIAKQITNEGDGFAQESAILMLAASLGIVLGGALASFVCRRGIELGLVPLGGLVMVIGTLALAATPMDSQWLKIWFVVAGAGGALLLIPLNANLQDICPPKKRGKILAGLNLLDCLAGLLAVLLQVGLVALGVSFTWQFVGLAIVCVIATNYAAKILPQHFIRLLVLGMFKIFYRIKVLHAERVPKEGGVLLTPNHVSYIDAFILSTACPRKIRFLMFDEYFKHRWIGPFVRIFDTVPISSTRAKEALRVAAEALEEGAVVCIFPEGQLARTGVMNDFKRGFEMIARKANCPVLPAAMDGLWGSIFSFERNKFLYKLPYRIPYGVTIGFGEPVLPKEAKAELIKCSVEELRAEAFAIREAIVSPLKILQRNISVLHGDAKVFGHACSEILALAPNKQSEVVANALQIGEINAIRRKQTVMIEWDALAHCRDVLAIAFVQFFKLKVILIDSETDPSDIRQLAGKHQVDQYFSGKNLAAKWLGENLPGGCYDFSGSAMRDEKVFACLTQADRVVSMSMPHPAARTATNQHQDGYLMGAWGRLLPGFHAIQQGSEIHVRGAALGDGILKLENKKLNLDAIVCPSDMNKNTLKS